MSRPIIAVTSEVRPSPDDPRTPGIVSVNANYCEMIIRAGGTPLILPPHIQIEDVVDIFDGWLLIGGRDIDAKHFGQVNHPKAELQDPSRFELESNFYRKVSEQLPIFGICLGCQFLNVIQGGTLYQHLPDLPTSEVHTGGAMQSYEVQSGTNLRLIAGEETIQGKSYHHQAIDQLGEGVVASAFHKDGTVEAIEIPNRNFVVGVQWHPERTPDSEATQRLFAAFIQKATEYKEGRRLATAIV